LAHKLAGMLMQVSDSDNLHVSNVTHAILKTNHRNSLIESKEGAITILSDRKSNHIKEHENISHRRLGIHRRIVSEKID
jgi:hypothetical protein